jgi:hypothetical protein
VQYVLRPNLDYRSFAGQIASGVVKKGDSVMVLPSRKTTKVKAIDTFEGERDSAFAPMSVTLRLEDEIDISRGDMLVHPKSLPEVGRDFEAMLVWMNERALDREKSYLLKHTTLMTRAEITEVLGHTDLETLAEVKAEGLGLNDIGRVRVRTHRPLYFDGYATNRETGAFILIDSISNNTVGAGMILSAAAAKSLRGTEESRGSQVSSRERRERLGQAGAVVWVHGADEGRARALAYAIERRLFDEGRVAAVVPVQSLAAEAVGPVAQRLAEAGVIAICAARAVAGVPFSPGIEVVEIPLAEADAPGRSPQDLDQDPEERAAAAAIALLEAKKLFAR